jgi:CRP-like cAMP-binding protein
MKRIEADILSGLGEHETDQVLALGSPQPYSVGEVVFDLGDEARSLFLVRSGRVDLTLPLRVQGKEEDVAVEERVPGQMLGWSALVPPHRFTLKATVRADAEFLVFPREHLLEFFSREPGVGWRVMANVAAIMSQRFQVFQAMWLRQVQVTLEHQNA